MLKKILAAMCSSLLVTTALAGCSQSSENGSGSNTNSTETSSAEVEYDGDLAFRKFDDVVEIHIGQGVSTTDSLPAGKSVDNNQYTDYLFENYNIKIVCDWTASGTDFNQKVALCIASNTLPDGVNVSRQYMLKAAQSGLLYDLTDLFQQYASDQVKEVMESTGGRAYEDVTVDGKQVAIPGVEVETGGVQVLNIRQDWLDQLGLDAPKTLSDVENIAQAFLENKPAGDDTIPIIGPDKNNFCYSTFLDSATTTCGFDLIFTANDAYPGFWVEDGEGSLTYGTLSDNTRETLELLADWYAKGYIDPEMGTRDSSIEMINAGRVGMYFGAWWMIGYGTGDAYRNDSEANWQSYAIYNDEGVWNTKMGSSTSNYTIINKNCTEDEAAAIIIMANALLRDEKYFDVSEEPLNYWPIRTLMAPADECEYTYEQLIKILDGEAAAEDYAEDTSSYKLLGSDAAMVLETVPGYEKGRQLSVTDFNMENFGNFQRMYSLLVGDRPYATEENINRVHSLSYSSTDTIDSRWSNLKSMEDETILKIITGKTDISEFDTFVERWHSEGGDAILAEVQDLISES